MIAETEQDLILQIIIDNHTKHCRDLASPEYQNELYLRYLAQYVPDINELIYTDKSMPQRCATWVKIEYAVAYAADVMKEHQAPHTKQQLLVHTVLEDAKSKNVPIDPYHDSTRLVFRCWKLQDEWWRRFLDDNWHVESAAIGAPATAISVTRLRRFAEQAIRAKYQPVI